MVGFVDYLRRALGWWAVPSTAQVPDPACFRLAVETPSYCVSVELPVADGPTTERPLASLELIDCC